MTEGYNTAAQAFKEYVPGFSYAELNWDNISWDTDHRELSSFLYNTSKVVLSS
jgi:hypothetical protein